MANPNVVNVATISGKTQGHNATTTPSSIVTNSSGSGKLVKINSVYVSNIDGAVAASVTLTFEDSSASGSYALVNTVSVPADATLVVISKNESIYLEEGDSINCSASVDGDLQVVVSYEEIS